MARTLEADFPKEADTQPALLAHHFTEASLYPQAIAYWRRAGAQAFQRGAHQEALAHLRRGRALLEGMPEREARRNLELELSITLGPLCMVTQGMTAPEVERLYRRAYTLCQPDTEIPQRFAVLRGLHHVYRAQGRLHLAREFAEQLLALARYHQDATLLLEAHMSLGMVLVPLGEFAAALDHLEQGLAYRDAATYPLLPDISHPALGCLFYSGYALWYLGYPDQAQARIQAGLELAQQLVSPYHLVWGQHLGAVFYQLCRDLPRMRELADAVVLGAARQGLQIGHLTGMVLQGWALVQGRAGRGGDYPDPAEPQPNVAPAALAPVSHAIVPSSPRRIEAWGDHRGARDPQPRRSASGMASVPMPQSSCGCRESCCWRRMADVTQQKMPGASR